MISACRFFRHVANKTTVTALRGKSTEQIGFSSDVKKKIGSILGSKQVSENETVRQHHGRDEGPYRTTAPDLVVFPHTTEQVVEVVKICYDSNIPMIPFGTGTGLEGGVNAVQGGVCLDLSQMDQVLELNVDDFDVTVQPGITRKGLNLYLKDTGLWFPVDPGANASICGMVATSASGTNAVRYGTMKENVLNLEVVLADGTLMYTAGKGRRSRKSAAGYNLTSLIVGSEGTLGIITAATVKLHVIPETMISAVCRFHTVGGAVETTIQTLQSNIPIARIELLDDISMRACNLYSKMSYIEVPTLFMEFHGSASDIEIQAKAVENIALANEGSGFEWAVKKEEREALWKARHELYYACLSLVPGSKSVITDVCVPISKLAEMVSEAKEIIAKSGVVGPILGHVGDGNFHAMLLHKDGDDNQYKAAKAVAIKLAEKSLELGGTCSGEHGIGQGKIQLLEKEVGPGSIEVMKNLKQVFDPKGLLNPEKILNMGGR